MFRSLWNLLAVFLVLCGVAQAFGRLTIDGVFAGFVAIGGLMILADALWDRAHVDGGVR